MVCSSFEVTENKTNLLQADIITILYNKQQKDLADGGLSSLDEFTIGYTLQLLLLREESRRPRGRSPSSWLGQVDISQKGLRMESSDAWRLAQVDCPGELVAE